MAERNFTSEPARPVDPVLIVDDDHSMRRLIAAALALSGFRTLEATGGSEALEVLRRQRVCLVLLDSRMPAMSGLEVLVAIRARPDGHTLPVILVTGDDEVDDRVRGLQAGADDYVVKPFHPDELVARVRAQLRNRTAWADTVERQLRERSAVAAALCRLGPEPSVEAMADRICTQLCSHRAMSGAAVLAFLGEGLVLPLATQRIDAWSMRPGRPLPAAIGRYLESKAQHGPWIERPDAPGAAVGAPTAHLAGRASRTAACAPLVRDGELFGLLVLAAGGPDDHDWDAHAALSASIDFAALAAGLLSPGLVRKGRYRERRTFLDEVLRDHAFSPVFQPIVELRGAQVIGFEALTRFHDGTSPETRFAEAAAVDRGVELEAATLLKAVRASPALPSSAWLSLNVSPVMVLDDDVLPRVVELARRPLVLELTEHHRVEDYPSLRQAVARLGEQVRLSVDDAGSGFASLRHVLALEPHYVKLDQTWISGIHDDPARQALVAGLGHFARHTGAVLIAEGIESDDELAVLRNLAVELGQGFLFGRPEPAGSDQAGSRARSR